MHSADLDGHAGTTHGPAVGGPLACRPAAEGKVTAPDRFGSVGEHAAAIAMSRRALCCLRPLHSVFACETGKFVNCGDGFLGSAV
jgi:hypothetical protein